LSLTNYWHLKQYPDANGDGMISIDELEQMFTKPQSLSEMLTLLFSIGDADGDGELTKDEVTTKGSIP